MNPLDARSLARAARVPRLRRMLWNAGRAIWMALVDRHHPARVAATREQLVERERLLEEARIAIRVGCYDDAHIALQSIATSLRGAEWLNLLGVINERYGHWNLARRCYGRAMRADRSYAPAEQNMRRIFELYTFGRSEQTVVLGDERPALAALLRQADSHLWHAPPIPSAPKAHTNEPQRP